MKYSFQLYSARNFTPWEEVFKSISELGYQQVEGYGGVYETPDKIRALLDSNNLEMPSGHFSLDSLENDLDATVKVANTLGCKNIFCPHVAEEQRPDNEAGWQSFANRLTEVGKKITDKGLRFGWHNHDFEFVACSDGSVPMRVILESAAEIDWEIDVAWAARAGSDPASWIKEFGARITAAHIKDIAAEGECSDEDGWADVGFGTMDWKSLLGQLQNDTRASIFIAEHDNPNDHNRFASRTMQSLKTYA